MNLTSSISWWASAIGCVLAVIGCSAGTGTSSPSANGQDADIMAQKPDSVSLLEAHNARVEELERLYSRGVIELNWTDEKGRHREQGDLDLYLELPRRTAFRISKVGETYFWFGSDAQRFWVFDLSDDARRTLLVDEHDRSAQLVDEASLLPPLALLDLMGLSKLTAPAEGRGVDYDDELDAWIVTGRGEGGAVRLFVDRRLKLPSRVESLSENGEIRAASRIFMERYRSVPVSGRPEAAWPRMATNVDIIATAPSEDRSGFLKIALGQPTTIVEGDVLERVFDLDRLTRAYRPHVIETGPELVETAP